MSSPVWTFFYVLEEDNTILTYNTCSVAHCGDFWSLKYFVEGHHNGGNKRGAFLNTNYSANTGDQICIFQVKSTDTDLYIYI